MACGYLLNGAGATEVSRAIQAAASGGMVFGASLSARVATSYVSDKTVRNVVSSICAKLHAADRADAIIKARDAGLGRD